MAKDAVEPSPPMVLAMLLADHIYKDRGTGKHFILGTFSDIRARRFPCVHAEMDIYVSLTEGRGPTLLRVRIVDVDEEREPVIQTESTFQLTDPNKVYEITIQLRKILFPTPGDYRVQLWAGREFLHERRLGARQDPPHP